MERLRISKVIRWPGGLRTRMILVFVLVAMLAASAASTVGYVAARGSLISEAQRGAVAAVREQVTRLAPEVRYPPDQSSLERLRSSLGANSMVTFQNRTAASGPHLDLISDQLRAAVAGGNRFVVQRVVDESGPKLLVATPLLRTGIDGERSDSGIDIFVVRDLGPIQAQLDQWTRAVAYTIVAALPLAIALALLVSRSVLRPVRRLAESAKLLAAGKLDTRMAPTGRDELADLAATFDRTAAALERTVEQLRHSEAEARRFVADVSHELRTPIMALTSIMEMIQTDARRWSAEDRKMAMMAVDRTRSLARLTEDLLEMSRLDAGAVRLRLEQIDVPQAISEALRSRGWIHQVRFVSPGPVLAWLDVRRLDIMVANLVGNALTHGGAPVVVELMAEADALTITVTDQGPGLPAQLRVEQLFSRFYKAESSRTGTGGSGLGLSIALASAHLHGGDLSGGNVEGAGARFVLRLPRGRPPEPAESAEPAESTEESPDD